MADTLSIYPKTWPEGDPISSIWKTNYDACLSQDIGMKLVELNRAQRHLQWALFVLEARRDRRLRGYAKV